ncbi:MAG TPA: hypothetical protein VMW27_06570 [Thermoanaerobaculia bacterium]|nr:hypothetical protein [Thermoanaerobaculia bacterium]
MHRPKRSTDALRQRRWAEFRKRADFAPESVYRHRTHGWEYIPVHPFGDEHEVLESLGLRPEDCRNADAWWGIDGDATLLESGVVDTGLAPGLFAKASRHEERWVYLVALFDAPYVTRALFEEAMVRFAEAGFPHDPRFRVRQGAVTIATP